ncbi:MAG: SIMPL domain-containing protein [Bacteroidales bacterium]|nr:SIMPL domain-containing protein [Bacteroidales bacterium]
MRKWIIEAAIIAAGMFCMGMCIMNGLDSFADKNRVVSVKGLAEREVEADKVIWPLIYKQVGNDLTALYTQISNTNHTIIDFLKQKGLTDEEISINAPEIIDMQAERYNSSPVVYRYNVTGVITVVSSQVALVRDLMQQQSELLRQGIAVGGSDYRYNIQYQFTKLNDIKPQMIEQATKNARAAAEKFAIDSNSRLGKIMRANQGQFSIENRDENTPYIKKVRVVTTIDYALQD